MQCSRRGTRQLGLLMLPAALLLLSPALLVAQDEPEQGAAAPRLAAQRLLAALQAGESELVLAVLSSDMRLEWDAKVEPLLDALQIESYELGEFEREGAEATLHYRWSHRFSPQLFRDGVRAQVRLEMEEQGMDEAQIRRVLEAMEQEVREEAAELEERFDEEVLEMEMVREEDGRWYVSAFARPPQAEGGGASPEAAARQMLEAWRDAGANRDTLLAQFSELGREQFLSTDGEALLAALTVERFELGEPQAIEGSENEVELSLRWQAHLDAERYERAMLAVLRRDLAAEGLAGEELAEELEFMSEELERESQAVRSAFERREHTMLLLREEGRWYVEQLIVDSTPDGTTEAGEAVYTLLDALAFDDPRMGRYVIEPKRRAEQLARDGLAWIRAINLTSSEPGELSMRADEDEQGERAKMDVRWQATFERERYERAARNAQIERLQRQGLESEAIQERLAETRPDREAYAEKLQQLAEAERIAVHLIRHNERWYVERLAPAK